MIYLFYGDDHFSLNEELKKLKQDNIPAEALDFNFVKLDALKSGFTLDEVINTADSFPFLSDKRVVAVTGLITRLGKSAAAEERAATRAAIKGSRKSSAPATPRERMVEFVPKVPATTILVLVEEKVDKRDIIYKAIDKQGAVREFKPLENFALEKWINERAAQDGIKLTREVAPRLAAYLGGDLHRIYNELQKLAAYAGEGQPITAPMVEQLTVEVQDTLPWALTDALANSDFNKALGIFNRMRNETTLNRAGFTRYAFGMISKQLFDMTRIKEMYEGSRKTEAEIAQATGIHPFKIKNMLPLTRKFSSGRLDRLYARMTELDYLDKSGKADLATQMDIFIYDICASR